MCFFNWWHLPHSVYLARQTESSHKEVSNERQAVQTPDSFGDARKGLGNNLYPGSVLSTAVSVDEGKNTN